MKILILGMLGAGKSTLAYNLCQDYRFSRLNLDEIARDKMSGEWFSEDKQLMKLDEFVKVNESWVAEGVHKKLYECLKPDFIIYVKVSRFVAAWRFTIRFLKAKKLIGKTVDADLPVQAYHYRKPTFSKICDWDRCNKNIRDDIEEYIGGKSYFVFNKKSDYKKICNILDNGKLSS